MNVILDFCKQCGQLCKPKEPRCENCGQNVEARADRCQGIFGESDGVTMMAIYGHYAPEDVRSAH